MSRFRERRHYHDDRVQHHQPPAAATGPHVKMVRSLTAPTRPAVLDDGRPRPPEVPEPLAGAGPPSVVRPGRFVVVARTDASPNGRTASTRVAIDVRGRGTDVRPTADSSAVSGIAAGTVAADQRFSVRPGSSFRVVATTGIRQFSASRRRLPAVTANRPPSSVFRLAYVVGSNRRRDLQQHSRQTLCRIRSLRGAVQRRVCVRKTNRGYDECRGLIIFTLHEDVKRQIIAKMLRVFIVIVKSQERVTIETFARNKKMV